MKNNNMLLIIGTALLTAVVILGTVLITNPASFKGDVQYLWPNCDDAAIEDYVELLDIEDEIDEINEETMTQTLALMGLAGQDDPDPELENSIRTSRDDKRKRKNYLIKLHNDLLEFLQSYCRTNPECDICNAL